MISLSNIAKAYGDRTLFEGVSLRLVPGARFGLVGANGSGKTTLLNILAGDDSPSDGELTLPSGARVGILRQDRYLSEEQSIIDVAMMGDREVWSMLQRQQQLLSESQADAHAIAELEEKVRDAGGYTLEARAGAVLEGLGIAAEKHPQALSTLSGGFKLRVLLAQVLVGNPDLLLLDEPTNHLDILTIRWLESFLAKLAGCAVVISHDHRFLDNVATHILDVDYGTVTLYHGNYSRFMVDKQETRDRKEAEIGRVEKEIADKKAFVERFRYKSTKARQAQSRLKQIEKLDIPDLPSSSRRAPFFRFDQLRPSGREVLTLEGVAKSFGDNHVLRDVSLTVRRGERVAVIGANGLGKSTLLKIMVDRLDPDAGELRWGYEAKVGYFAQNHRDLLGDSKQTALDYLWEICPDAPTSFVRGQLGRMLFSGEDVDKQLRSLSGGEAARLVFSRLIVQRPNVLLLDEPTNHLDLESIEALVKALRDYTGTLLFVSHDRWFVSELATRIVELRSDGFEDFPGDYADYLARCGDDHLDAGAVALKAANDRSAARDDAGQPKAGSDYQEQKRRRNLETRLSTRRDEVTADIEQAEKRQAQIEQLYCEPGFFEQTDPAEVEALQSEQAALGPRIEQLMAEWEQIEEQLAELGSDD